MQIKLNYSNFFNLSKNTHTTKINKIYLKITTFKINKVNILLSCLINQQSIVEDEKY